MVNASASACWSCCASIPGEKLSIRRIVSVVVYCVAMVLSLIFVREHYTMIGKSIFGPAVKMTVDFDEKYGEENVCALLNLKYMDYYEAKYGHTINNKYKGYNPMALCKQLENEHAAYLIAANLDDIEMYVAKRYYPYVVNYSEYIGAELYVMSKKEEVDHIIHEPIFDRIYDLSGYNVEDEWFTLLDTPFVALSDSRFEKLEFEMSYMQNDTTDDFLIALQTFDENGESYDWREARVKNFYFPVNDSVRSVLLPMRFELIFKDSRELSNYSIKMFLWNIDHVKSVRPLSARIRITPDNKYIYSFTEELE